MRKLKLSAAALLVTAGLFSSCTKNNDNIDPNANANITALVSANANLSLLRAAVVRAGLAETLGNSNTTAANITATDMVATNGVVHLIDDVLKP